MEGASGESAVVAGVDMVGGVLVFKWQPLSDGRQLEHLFFDITQIHFLHFPPPLPSMCLNDSTVGHCHMHLSSLLDSFKLLFCVQP